MALLPAGLAAATVAGARGLDRSWRAPVPLTAVDTSWAAVAGGLAWRPGACEGAVVWVPEAFTRWTVQVPGPCPAVSTGRGVSAVAATAYPVERVAFLSFVGGNTREWRLWTATQTARRPRLLRTASADAGSPSPIVLGDAGQDGIVYAVGREVVVLGANGRRVLTWHAPARVVAVTDGPGRLAVTRSDGSVDVVAARGGAVLFRAAHSPGDVLEAVPFLTGVAVETSGGLEVDLQNGAVTDLDVGRGAHLVGYAEGRLAYRRGNELRLVSWRTRKDVLLRRLRPGAFASYDLRGLAWTSGRTLCWATAIYADRGAHPNAPGC